jgi:2-polyprenyl-6-methoxyphenol hydroxylase-like FAD-dependent oxidoreductase
MGLPLWLPKALLNMSKVSARKAVDAGMTLMPLEDIVQSTIDWFRDEPEREWPAGMSEDQEQRLLEAWRQQKQR